MPRPDSPPPRRSSGRPQRPAAGQSARTPRAGGDKPARTPRTAGSDQPPRGRTPRPPATTSRAADRPERQHRPAGPALPPDADPRLLPSDVRRELRALQDAVADRVAAHLVAAGQLLDEDPAAAYEHAKYAKTFASRVGAIREAVGVTAYAAGDYAAALTELKAARRITGLPDHLPLIADAERAVGHPERALAIAADPDVRRLDRSTRIELAIVTSGARRDLGQPDAAVVALQGPDLDSDAVEEWTPRLWYAYADALLAAGRRDEAAHWFTAVVSIDEDGETDAEERLAALSPPAGA